MIRLLTPKVVKRWKEVCWSWKVCVGLPSLSSCSVFNAANFARLRVRTWMVSRRVPPPPIVQATAGVGTIILWDLI